MERSNCALHCLGHRMHNKCRALCCILGRLHYGCALLPFSITLLIQCRTEYHTAAPAMLYRARRYAALCDMLDGTQEHRAKYRTTVVIEAGQCVHICLRLHILTNTSPRCRRRELMIILTPRAGANPAAATSSDCVAPPAVVRPAPRI